MALDEHPDLRKLSPSHQPDLPVRELYLQGYQKWTGYGLNQSAAIQKVAEMFEVCTSTIYTEMFPDKKNKYSKIPTRQWSYTIEKPDFSREKFNEERAYRIKVRRYMDRYISLAYRMTEKKTMELPELANTVYQMTGVKFRPSSLLTISASYQKKNGYPLIERYTGFQIPRYAPYQPKK